MVLETSRLYLRKHQLEDYDRFWEMLNDPVAKQYTGGTTKLSFEDRLAVYIKDCDRPFSDEQTEFAIIDKTSGIYLGYCGIMPAQDIDGIEFFYGLCRDSWGKGYGFEATKSALAYFFNHYKHERYVATVDLENTNSAKLLKKLGFCKTGQITNNGCDIMVCFEAVRASNVTDSD